MTPFHQICTSLAMQETRSFIVPKGHQGRIPAGEYGLLESYCTEPDCDCQLVLFTVIKRDSDGVEATISMGFDADDDLSEPMLDPLNPQGSHAMEILEFVIALIASDAEYRERLQRHYAITKQIVSGQLRPENAPSSKVIQKMRPVDFSDIPQKPVREFGSSSSGILEFVNRAERRRQMKQNGSKR